MWENILKRAADAIGGQLDLSQFDLEALAKRGGSGRDINSAARLAVNLSYHRKQPITQALMMEVLDVADDFRKDFEGGLKAHAEAGRISDDEED